MTSKLIPASSKLAIIGAGPIGLEALAWAASRNWNAVLFEKGTVGHHIRQWGHVRLFSPFSMNHSSWGPGLLSHAFPDLELPSEYAYLTGEEYIHAYLEPLATLPEIRGRVFTGSKVLEIGKDRISKKDSIGGPQRLKRPFRLLLERDGHELIHKTEAVIDASGVFSSPQFLGSGNIPAPGEQLIQRTTPGCLHYGIVDVLGKQRKFFANKAVLLVGGGHSAATVLEAFLELVKLAPSTRVFWVNRSSYSQPYYVFPNDPFPYRDELNKLANGLASQPFWWLCYRAQSAVEEIRPKSSSLQVVIDSPQGHETVDVDQIIACAGFRPNNSIYRQLQVHECYATAGPIKLAATLLAGSPDCLAQQSQGIDTLKNPEPNFFILGNKSYGTNTTFLLAHGIGQVQAVMEYLAKNDQWPPVISHRLPVTDR